MQWHQDSYMPMKALMGIGKDENPVIGYELYNTLISKIKVPH